MLPPVRLFWVLSYLFCASLAQFQMEFMFHVVACAFEFVVSTMGVISSPIGHVAITGVHAMCTHTIPNATPARCVTMLMVLCIMEAFSGCWFVYCY